MTRLIRVIAMIPSWSNSGAKYWHYSVWLLDLVSKFPDENHTDKTSITNDPWRMFDESS
jgi:hypothetical protein